MTTERSGGVEVINRYPSDYRSRQNPYLTANTVRQEVKAAVEELFTDVNLDDLFAARGWLPGSGSLPTVSLLGGLLGYSKDGGDLRPGVAEEAELVDVSLDVALDGGAAGDEGLEVGLGCLHASRLVDDVASSQEADSAGQLTEFLIDRVEDEGVGGSAHAIRNVIAAHSWETDEEGFSTDCADCWQPPPCLTLRLLAATYADHPDYRPEWRAPAVGASPEGQS